MSDTSTNTTLKELHILRQAFVVASLFIVTGLVCAYFVHPYFLALPALVAGGLLFSGIVGWCPMVFILERMPWNRNAQ